MPKNTNAKRGIPSRSRIFATVVYPESAPEDWRERLEGEHVKAMVSPLHCLDTLPTGEVKKAHYHVLWSLVSPGHCHCTRLLQRSQFRKVTKL